MQEQQRLPLPVGLVVVVNAVGEEVAGGNRFRPLVLTVLSHRCSILLGLTASERAVLRATSNGRWLSALPGHVGLVARRCEIARGYRPPWMSQDAMFRARCLQIRGVAGAVEPRAEREHLRHIEDRQRR